MTTDRRRLLDADDFRAELAEAETFLLANKPKQPTPSKDEERELAELHAQLDEAAALRDAALTARVRARRALVEAREVERARVTEGQGFAGLVDWVKGARKVPSVTTAKAAVEEAEARFLESEAIQDRAHRDLNAAAAQVARSGSAA